MFSRAQTQERLPFATTTYKADEHGVLRPELPSRCVFATGAETCSIFVDHYRLRKTGPCFPVAIVGCVVHPQRRYTLYPPGHFPYGRVPVAPYSRSGELLLDDETGRPPWGSTLFAAAVDAANGERWASESSPDDVWRYRTQGCRLRPTARLVGVHPELDQGERERIATRLAVPTMTVLAGARAWDSSWEMRGAAIVSVVEAIPIQATLLDRILAAGAIGGLWGTRRPQRWDANRGTWVVAPLPLSEGSEHPGAAFPRGRGPPPTKSPDAATPEGVLPSGS